MIEVSISSEAQFGMTWPKWQQMVAAVETLGFAGLFRADHFTIYAQPPDDDALELIVVKGYSVAFGARFLKRFIDEHIKLPISTQWKNGSHFDVRAVDGAIAVEPGIAKVSSAMAFGDVA